MAKWLVTFWGYVCTRLKYSFVASPLRTFTSGPGFQTTVPLDRARSLIAESIGQKWQDFARALRVPEGEIDQLARLAISPMNRVYQIIDYHQRNCYDSRQFEITLLEALGEARRNDLRLKVQNILY